MSRYHPNHGANVTFSALDYNDVVEYLKSRGLVFGESIRFVSHQDNFPGNQWCIWFSDKDEAMVFKLKFGKRLLI